MKFEVFERLNTGGLALNAQEIRNAIYRGSFNEMLKTVESDRAFRAALGIRQSPQNDGRSGASSPVPCHA
jgi:hypothetical protein